MDTGKKIQIYLTRRNLYTLLSKLNRNKQQPGASKATLEKVDDRHPKFPQTVPSVFVTAVEDEDYYIDRTPGAIHPEDANCVERKGA